MGDASATRARTIVMLRGVNVGGHRLAMPLLREVLEGAGCTDVVTYIQSGNAVVTPPSPEPPAFDGLLSEAISTAAGYEVPVVLRTRTEMTGVVAANPYPGAQGKHLVVIFYPEAPPPEIFEGVDPASFLPEEWTLIGRDLYLSLPNGMGRSPLSAALDKAGRRRAGGTRGTARNWNTVLKLLELARS